MNTAENLDSINVMSITAMLFSDIDDCSLTVNPCSGNGVCYDQVNSYICKCSDGYTGDNCQTYQDGCTPNPCLHGNCSSTPNDFNCTCDSGYDGKRCDNGKLLQAHLEAL